MECSIPSDEYDSVLFNACTIQENIMFNESLNFSLHESANIFHVPPIPTPKQSDPKETRFLICDIKKTNLKRLRMKYTDKKLFHCTECGEKFTRKSYLKVI